MALIQMNEKGVSLGLALSGIREFPGGMSQLSRWMNELGLVSMVYGGCDHIQDSARTALSKVPPVDHQREHPLDQGYKQIFSSPISDPLN